MRYAPEGVYRVKFLDHYTRNVGSSHSPSLVLNLCIADGPYAGLPVSRWYNVRRLIDGAGRKGKFIAKNVHDARSVYAREYRQITGRGRLRADRMSPAAFRDFALEGRLTNTSNGPKLIELWKPVATSAARREDAPRMPQSCHSDAPKMPSELPSKVAAHESLDSRESVEVYGFAEGRDGDDVHKQHVRDRDVRKEEHANKREKESTGTISSSCIEASSTAIGSIPHGVNPELWRKVDEEERAWMADYVETLRKVHPEDFDGFDPVDEF